MTDNITLNPGTGGDVIRAEDKGGAKTQVMLLDIGGTGAESLVASSNPLPVTGTVTVSGVATAARQDTGNASLAAIASAVAGTLGIGGTVSIDNLPATQAISAASLPLPSGAATSAKQDAIIAALGTPLQAGGSVDVANFPATQAISAASLPLPTGAATAANQATGNTSLANLDTDVGAIDAEPAAADGTGNYSLIAAAKRALLNWANLLARLPVALGQTTMANSLPVAIASNQSAVPVSGTVALSALPALVASTATIGGTIGASGFSDSTTALGIAATFTGTGRATTSAFSAFVARAYADQAGTLFIEQTINGSASWEPIASVAVAAGTAGNLRADQTGAPIRPVRPVSPSACGT